MHFLLQCIQHNTSQFSRPLSRLARLPAAVRVVRYDLTCDACRVTAEIFLIDNAVLVDDEGHDAGIAIGGRIGDHREAARHTIVEDVIPGAAGRIRPLLGQNPEIVAVIGPRLHMRGAGPVTGRPGLGDERAQRAFLFAWFDGPIEPITLSNRAHVVLRIFRSAAGAQISGGIFALGRDVDAAHRDDTALIAADAPIKNLIGAGVECRSASGRACGRAGLEGATRLRRRPELLFCRCRAQVYVLRHRRQ